MTRVAAIAFTASAVLMAGSSAHADVTMNSVRVAGTDTVALAKFYQSAFGMYDPALATRGSEARLHVVNP